jgi:hypothetical protein
MAGSPKKRAKREAAARASAEAAGIADGTVNGSETAPQSAFVPTVMEAEPVVRRVSPPMTEELFVTICERVANGSSLLKISKEEGMPSRDRMERWIDANEERRKAYEWSRQARAEHRVEMIDGIVAKLNAGTIDPNAARVMIEAIRWQAAKEKPRRFGDKIQHETDVVINGEITIQHVRDGILRKLARIATAREAGSLAEQPVAGRA